MTLDLSTVEWTGDFFYATLPYGNTLVLNKINESIRSSDGTVTDIDRINIVIVPYNETTQVLCSSVIGIGNSYITLYSDYADYVGKTLTSENMKYCGIEIKET